MKDNEGPVNPPGSDANTGRSIRPPRRIRTRKRGVWLLKNPATNKGLAFDASERERLGLKALLPSRILTIEEQVALEMERLSESPNPLDRYVSLAQLQDRNEVLFYRVLVDHLAELMPIVYTPTVGLACQRFSHIHRNVRGIWLTPDDVDRIPDLLRQFTFPDVRLIVATDNERILGLGDQGAGGMGIPVGKLALYVAGAGIHPSHVLPVSLDVGTNNPALLEDPFYVGYRARRLRGQEYDRFIEAFVSGVREVFPATILQWEDFQGANAFRLLERYRHTLPSFNDDIQGTAAVVVAGVIAASRITNQALSEHRALFFGGGGANAGVHALLCRAMREAGASEEDARRAHLCFDVNGLLREDAGAASEHQRDMLASRATLVHYGLDPDDPNPSPEDVIRAMKPTVLIGATATPGVFRESMLRAMADHVERPIVLPLSNPTHRAECSPAEALAWTDGRAIVATGSPFDDVTHAGERRIVGQANNVFIFPGLGLGTVLGGLESVTDDVLLAAASALASCVSEDRLKQGAIFPDVRDLRHVSEDVAVAVIRAAETQAEIADPPDDDALRHLVRESMWFPEYIPITAVDGASGSDEIGYDHAPDATAPQS